MIKYSIRCASGIALAVAATLSCAQPRPADSFDARMPTAKELEAARRQIPTAEQIKRAIQEQQQGQSVRVPEAALDPSRQVGPELSKLAEQYEQIRRGPDGAGKSAEDRQASGMLVFVSLGMPKASLERIVADAERTRATLVLRGARDLSFGEAAKDILSVMSQAKASWQIDPSLFKQFEIQAVPTYVLIDPARPVLVACGQSHCQATAYSKVAGDVSMSHALEVIELNDAEFADVARDMAARLRQPRPTKGGQP